MTSVLDYAPLHSISDFFGENDKFIEQLSKDIYHVTNVPEFLSIQANTST